MAQFFLGKDAANNVKLAIPDKVVDGSVYAELRVIGKISASFLLFFSHVLSFCLWQYLIWWKAVEWHNADAAKVARKEMRLVNIGMKIKWYCLEQREICQTRLVHGFRLRKVMAGLKESLKSAEKRTVESFKLKAVIHAVSAPLQELFHLATV